MVYNVHLYLLIFSCFSYWNFVSSADDDNGWGYPSKIIPLDKFGNKSYYFVHSFKATYLEATQFCQDVHMNLLTVDSRDENDFLLNKVKQYNKDTIYWTSGTKLVDGTDYIWLSTGVRVRNAYNNWQPGEPNTAWDYCLRLWLINNDLRFDDTSCAFTLYFICQRENNQIDQPKKVNQNWEDIFEDLATAPDVKLFGYKDKNYYVNNYFLATFLQAAQFCQLVDMELLSIESEEENTALYQQIRSGMAGTKFWSSGTRLIDDNNWYWLPTGNKINYYRWQDSRPEAKTSGKKCIQLNQDINKGIFWSDEACSGTLNFICQTSKKNIYTRNCPNAITANGCPAQITSSPAATVAPSPQQSTIVKKKKYYLGNEKGTFAESIQYCQKLSMQLVSIQNKEQNDEINNYLQQQNDTESYWTSGNKIADNQTWVWLNNEKISYFNWYPGEPNNLKKNEFCIEIFRVTNDSKWNDNPCDTKNKYICESWVQTAVQGQDQGQAQGQVQGQCSATPVVNVYVNNNVVTCNGTVADTKRISTTSNSRASGVEVNNNIADSNGQTVAPIVATTALPVKTKVHQRGHKGHSSRTAHD